MLVSFLQVLKGYSKVSPEPFLLQAKQAQLPQPFFIKEVLQPSGHLHGPPLDLLQELQVQQLASWQVGKLELATCSRRVGTG